MKFECKSECSACCRVRGEVQFVFLNEADLCRLELHLKKPRTEFASCARFDSARWKTEPHLRWYLKNDKPGACRFLEGHKCSVYSARPMQCRTYPFQADADLSVCPGVGIGHEYSPLDIEASEMLDRIEFEKGSL